MERDLHRELSSVLGEMRRVVAAKLEQYGDDRYREEDPRWAIVMCYSDVYRKHLRLRRLTEVVASDVKSKGDIEALRDCYLDMANYAAMAVQQIDYHYDNNEGGNDGR